MVALSEIIFHFTKTLTENYDLEPERNFILQMRGKLKCELVFPIKFEGTSFPFLTFEKKSHNIACCGGMLWM